MKAINTVVLCFFVLSQSNLHSEDDKALSLEQQINTFPKALTDKNEQNVLKTYRLSMLLKLKDLPQAPVWDNAFSTRIFSFSNATKTPLDFLMHLSYQPLEKAFEEMCEEQSREQAFTLVEDELKKSIVSLLTTHGESIEDGSSLKNLFEELKEVYTNGQLWFRDY